MSVKLNVNVSNACDVLKVTWCIQIPRLWHIQHRLPADHRPTPDPSLVCEVAVEKQKHPRAVRMTLLPFNQEGLACLRFISARLYNFHQTCIRGVEIIRFYDADVDDSM